MGQMGMQGMMGKEKSQGMMAERQQRHEQMEKMHQEMTQELQKQMTALRDHTKTMEGISDEKQLLSEMKKHQQMTDHLLGTMLEQHEKMHARMHAHHERMRSRMGKEQPAEGSGTEQSGEREQHHDK
jgi:Skp family chaperone for outer membrane proteins